MMAQYSKEGTMTERVLTFKWQPPNIHALPGAEWEVVKTPMSEADKNLGLWGGRGPTYRFQWKAPASVGDGFYKWLRKHYTKGPEGDYQ